MPDALPVAPATISIFPEHISHTQRSMFHRCPQQWFWTYCIGLRDFTMRGIDLRAGSAFAKGLEVTRKSFFNDGHTSEDAIEMGVEAMEADYGDEDFRDHKKARHRVHSAMLGYFRNWPLGQDYLVPAQFGPAGSGVEFRFAVPLPIDHPTTGQPLLYEGRVDMIARHKDVPGLWIVDEKTAGQLGVQWRRKWRLDAQPTSYVWAAKQAGFEVAGAIIRGISFLKDSHGFEEVLTSRSAHQIDDWYEQLLRDTERMISTFQFATDRRPDRALDKDVCSAYSGCPYLEACEQRDPTSALLAITRPRESAATAENILDMF